MSAVSASAGARIRAWIHALGAPRARALPALGTRLGSRPRLAGAVLAVPQRLPVRPLRAAAVSHVATPLVHGMDARLEVAVVGGSRMWVDTSDVTGRMLATSGIWEPHVTAVVRRYLRPGDVFVDVGANIGYFTLLGARLVGSDGLVHALEPSEGTLAKLVANLELNDVRNVVPERVAAGATSGEATLRDAIEGSNPGASSLRSDPERGWGVRKAVPVSVRLRTLAEVVTESDWPRLRLVKVDVEGYESDVLAGLEPILSAGHRPAVAVELHCDIDPHAVDFVVDFARRYDLVVRRVVDQRDAERRWAADHPLFHEYDEPGLLTAVDDPRVDVLLTPRAAEVRAP